jgi:hypothetical protein
MARFSVVAPFFVALVSCCPSTSTPAIPVPQVVADAAPDAPPTPEPVSDAMTSSFVPGPALSPSEPLLAWLQASVSGTDRKLLRLPVVINFANPGRFSFGNCWIGTDAAATPPADAVLIKPDSTALSVSLVEQVKQKCEKTLTCVLWLDGLWGPAVEGAPATPQPPGTPTKHPFAVMSVGEVVDAASTTHGFVKG